MSIPSWSERRRTQWSETLPNKAGTERSRNASETTMTLKNRDDLRGERKSLDHLNKLEERGGEEDSRKADP